MDPALAAPIVAADSATERQPCAEGIDGGITPVCDLVEAEDSEVDAAFSVCA